GPSFVVIVSQGAMAGRIVISCRTKRRWQRVIRRGESFLGRTAKLLADVGLAACALGPSLPGHLQLRHLPATRPFGGMGKPVDENGFSDHFPIGAQVTEAD